MSHDQDDAVEIMSQATQAALYLRTLKDQGMSDFDALELTKAWIAEVYESARDYDG